MPALPTDSPGSAASMPGSGLWIALRAGAKCLQRHYNQKRYPAPKIARTTAARSG